jgi:hypothetical protein
MWGRQAVSAIGKLNQWCARCMMSAAAPWMGAPGARLASRFFIQFRIFHQVREALRTGAPSSQKFLRSASPRRSIIFGLLCAAPLLFGASRFGSPTGLPAIGSGPERYWLGCVAAGAEAVCGTSSRRNSRLLPERRCARKFVNGVSAKGLGAARMRKRIGLRAIVGDLFLQRIGKHEAIAAESLGVIKGCIRSRDDLGQQALA